MSVVPVSLYTDTFVGFNYRLTALVLGSKCQVVPVIWRRLISYPAVRNGNGERPRQNRRVGIGRVVSEPIPVRVKNKPFLDRRILANELAAAAQTRFGI